jgi:hypothetical protein
MASLPNSILPMCLARSPESIFAIMSGYLESHEISGNLMRQMAGNISIQHRYGNITFSNGRIIAIDDDPNIIQYNPNGTLDYVAWTNEHNVLHKTHGPGIIVYEKIRTSYDMSYTARINNGIMGGLNDENPDMVYYGKNYLEKCWVEPKAITVNDLVHDGSFSNFLSDIEYHRVGGPAHIECDAAGNVVIESWYDHGELSNENGPAVVTYYSNGVLKSEEWYVNYHIRNVEGMPNMIFYNIDSTIKKIIYYGMVQQVPNMIHTYTPALNITTAVNTVIVDNDDDIEESSDEDSTDDESSIMNVE